MNLITDKWIPVLRKNGKDTIRPCQIVEKENPVIVINAPRPDFKGAIYQFLIGLLQTCHPPEDEDEWLYYWREQPELETLKKAFDNVKDAFELYSSDGPAFMQEYGGLEGKPEPLGSLLIEAPGKNTIYKNIDLFQKRYRFNCMCESCTAMTLYTLQINAPPGGAGHMAGLRGNGPLTTVIVEQGIRDNIFRSLWLNILPHNDVYESFDLLNSHIFPWLDKTKTSESCTTKKCKNGCEKCGIFPQEYNELQYFWPMPRRLRILSCDREGECELCGAQSKLFKQYITKPNGIRYVGGWIHPLTPYHKDSEKLPNPIKGEKAGNCYQHWVGLVLQDTDRKYHAAKVVSSYLDDKSFQINEDSSVALWCFGFDMEPGQAKARCWYEQILPLFYLEKDQKKNLIDWANELIVAARDIIKILRDQVKQALFRRPGDVKGDMSIIDSQFWQTTEPEFYKILNKLAKLPGNTRIAPPEIYESWLKTLEKSVFILFEKSALESIPEDIDFKRVMAAKNILKKKFYNNKIIKSLKAKATYEEEA